MRRRTLIFGLAVLVTASISFSSAAVACPACGRVLVPTWSERLAQSDAAVLVQWVSARKGSLEPKSPAVSTFEVLQIARDTDKRLKKGQRIFLPGYTSGKPGNLFFLWGKSARTSKQPIAWRTPEAVSETAYYYITQTPSPELAGPERLRFYLKFFEYPDPLISDDAYAEFAKARYIHVKALAKEMSRTKVRQWLASPETPQNRIGLYGLMLGLCGTKEDIPFLEKRIVQLKQKFRLGIDGVIAGYLMLVGDKGLDLIDREKFRKKKVPFSETYSALQAIRIIWTYGDGRIGKERLRQSMRILLERPNLVELVLPDLSRWKDWSVQSRLIREYGKGPFESFGARRSIIRYLIASTRDLPQDVNGPRPLPARVTTARKALDALKKKDPRAYRHAVRFAF
ncbi:MAG: hypothetical protein IID45_11230 [Planctomycetes bacterium]|nr:hypothetical protein [Planctomycetota bacterium]